MQVSITGRNLELTEPLKAYVSDKLQHLKHSFDQVVDVHAVLSVQKFHHQCEMTVQANGMVVHAKHDSEDMYASIDGVVDKLNRQLKRYRAKMHRHQTNHAQRKGREIKVSHRVVSMPPHDEELAVDQQPETLHHEEMAAKPSPEAARSRRDADEFDAVCDHLLVIASVRAVDSGARSGAPLIGVSRRSPKRVGLYFARRGRHPLPSLL